VTADVRADLAGAFRDALTRRLADLRAAAHRLEGFAFTPDDAGPPVPEPPGTDDATLRDLMLRALARGSDPLNYRLLHRLADGDASIEDLAEQLALPRLAVWERVNDLQQTGLVGRDERGRAGLTAAGGALVNLVEALVGEP
jgi:hypothetical protein